MCLTIKKGKKIRIAEKDIVVYKLYRYKLDDVYYSYYRSCPQKKGKLLRSKLIIENDEVDVGLHSYTYLKNAKNETMYRDGGILKCIIPKNSRYITGMFYKYRAIASNKLIIIEEIKY